jgi:hypothetical protein
MMCGTRDSSRFVAVLRRVAVVAVAASMLACGDTADVNDVRRSPLMTTDTAQANQVEDLYRFFTVAFGAAPGVTYMGQLLEAANAGMSIKAIVNVFTTKTQFTDIYPKTLTNEEFARRLVQNVVGLSAGATAKEEAVNDVVSALGLANWTRGDVVFAIFNNLAKKPSDDLSWGRTAKKMANQVAYARFFTEVMASDTVDLAVLRAVVNEVTEISTLEQTKIAAVINSVIEKVLIAKGQTFPPESFVYEQEFKYVTGFELPQYVIFTDGSLTPRIPNETGSMISHPIVGDLNNDGKDDIIITFQDTYMKPIILISNGDGTFTRNDNVDDGAKRRHIRNGFIIDVNGDGYKDFIGFTAPHPTYENILGSNWGFWEPNLILLNNKGISFSSVPNLPATSTHGGSVADIDGDGLLDVFGVAEAPQLSGSPIPRTILIQKQPSLFVSSNPVLNTGIFKNAQIHDMRIADLNGDKINDFVVLLTPAIPCCGLTNWYGTPMISSKMGIMAVAYGKNTFDLDSLEWNIMGTHWMSETQWETYLKYNDQNTGDRKYYMSGAMTIEVLDVNEDGKLDIMVALYVMPGSSQNTSGFKYFENTSNGFIDKTDSVFPNQETNRNIIKPTGFILGFNLIDINNDGLKDLVLNHKDYEGMTDGVSSHIFFVNQKNTFSPIPKAIVGNTLKRGHMYASGDINGDGKKDLISISSNCCPATKFIIDSHIKK